IGRRWGVGAKGSAGDSAKNLGVVLLLVPQKNHRPGTGQIFIATGRGAEGFLTDARVGRIRDAMTLYLAREDYGAALALGVDLVAQAFAQEFGITLSGAPPPDAGEGGAPELPIKWLILAVVLLIVFSRGRIFLLPFWLGGMGRGRSGWSGSGGGWGGGWGGGSGGGGGGGVGRCATGPARVSPRRSSSRSGSGVIRRTPSRSNTRTCATRTGCWRAATRGPASRWTAAICGASSSTS